MGVGLAVVGGVLGLTLAPRLLRAMGGAPGIVAIGVGLHPGHAGRAASP